MNAEQLMKEHRYAEAIAAYEAQLAGDPDDLVALLRLGLCHLLNRSEAAFRAIYHRAGALLAGLQEVPAPTARLWSHYQQLFVRVAASTVILAGAAGLAACETESAHRYSGGVYEGEGEGLQADGGVDAADASSAHRYSGGVYLDAGAADAGAADAGPVKADRANAGAADAAGGR